MSTPIVVLAGTNGVGKTTLLRAIWAAAAPKSASLGKPTSLILRSGSVTIELKNNQQTIQSKAVFHGSETKGDADLEIEVIHLDAAADAKRIQDEYCSFDSIDDIINGIGERPLTAEELDQINYLSHREYREVKLYEIESGSTVSPFFEVAFGADRYDSRTMGSGEQAALYLWWAVRRAPENALLLIEEPETYLSPACQEAAANLLVAAAVDRQLNVIITSHSAKIIDAFPSDEFILFLYRDGSGLKVASHPAPPILKQNLGMSHNVDTIALVEDLAAHHLLRRILELYRPALSRRTEIVVQGGVGEIVKALRSVGGRASSVKIIGVFDGDSNGNVAEEILPFSVFLPGDRAIELLFREALGNHATELGEALGRGDIAAILSGIQGMDHHEWYHSLCQNLGMTNAQLFPFLFHILSKDGVFSQSIKNFVDALSEMLEKRD